MISQKHAFLGLIAYPGLIFWIKCQTTLCSHVFLMGKKEQNKADHKMQNIFTSLIHMLQLHGQDIQQGFFISFMCIPCFIAKYI